MKREELLREPVKDVTIDPDMSISRLIKIYEDMYGFMAGHLARAVKVLARALREARWRFLAFTGNLVATGLRGILAQAIREELFNVVVTTCGTIDHDIARGTGGKYYKGLFEADDKMLKELEIHRLGNIFIPVEDYGPRIEKFVYKVLDELDRSRSWGIREVLHEIGKRIEDEHSILRAAYEKNVGVYVPGWLDGAFGTALFTYTRTHKDLVIDPFKDEQELADIVFGAAARGEKSAALIIGGGISKHHTIWWNQFKDGLDFVVYVTTAVEYDGSLSGAHPREAISWGKVRPEAEHVVVYGDATIIVPLLVAAMIEVKRGGR
ncbi:Deoxyhypusine synthase [Pyrolobus fumarii 1A]|uniref:Probable deoxyhypusine synthase n=1 Tax=Pyrolobus fumarii (strain DSM 11204 / 1A) TaxID=694429 RepID=G0EC86_PYRF1|nr:deoxyhypusine synthase [Pyrolobus fumarii]AEM39456.1 Deoxyhypusine synthase [Pyrolobus fumarii 1A]